MRSLILVAVAALLLFAMRHALATRAEVFTDRAHPVDTSGIRGDVRVECYELDQLDGLVRRMNRALRGKSPGEAVREARRLIRVHRRQIESMARGVRLASGYGIVRIPAIVLDGGRYTVLGETRLKKAIGSYRKWLKSH